MTNNNILRFYSAIRKDAETMNRLAAAPSEEVFIERIMEEARARGFEPTPELVHEGRANLAAIVQEAAAGEELTDMELEVVSGGAMFSTFQEHKTGVTLKWPTCERIA